MKWRLGLDLGTNSLGWAAIELDDEDNPCGVLAAGSRIFGDGRDPKSGASLAVDRRAARSMRRRGDRFKQRQQALIKHLTADGLFPADEAARRALAALDPYALRARALDEALSLPEIGRAFFHLNQRRGFQSNRKADRGKDDDSGKVKIGIDRLCDRIAEAGARTFGEWLHMRRAGAANDNEIPSVRTRLRPETGDDAKGGGYDFYPGRDLLKAEFDAIWEAQQPHHADVLTDEVHARLFEIIFHQRPLKAPRIGMCTLVAGEHRLPKAHPLFQQRRLLEELNALMIVRPGETAQRLTPDQRNLLLSKLKSAKTFKFSAMRRALKLDPAARLNKESENRTDLKGDEVAADMAAAKCFGSRWGSMTADEQWSIVARQQDVESEADEIGFVSWLRDTYALSAEQAKAVLGVHLPIGYGRFGLTATVRLIESLTDGRTPEGRLSSASPIEPGLVIVYSEAVVRAGLGHHSDLAGGDGHVDERGNPVLPYYGVVLERHIMPGTADPNEKDVALRIGRLTNPTVHVGLNQLREVVNRLIRALDPPKEIALELARDLKLSEDEKKKRNQENNRNRQEAEKRSGKLVALGQRDGGANRALLKLWEELNPGNVLDRRCIYTGAQISIDMLFSGAVEVDHILPFDATLDDSNANKLLCLREANREKRKRSPYEAWGHTDRWPEIAERAARLPKGKRWRFEPDAMQRFAEEGGFLARHLIDTQHLGRLARDYLTTLYPGSGEGSSHVWVSPGRLTEMVRRKLGLNSLLPDHNLGAEQPKNRKDHRHHAIDAVVVAILDRGMLNRIARASGEGSSYDDIQKIIVEEPWPGFRAALEETVGRIVVAHRPDHGTVSKVGLEPGRDQTAGRLHNDTAYGLTGETDAKGNSLVVHRVALTALKKAEDIARVRDPVLRAALLDFTAGFEGKAFERRILDFPRLGPLPYRDISRVRIVEPLTVIPIRDAQGRAYKGYKGDSNYRYDVWELPDGRWVTQWRDRGGEARCSIVSMFDAHRPGEAPRPHPAARKVLSLHQDDLLAIEGGEVPRRIMRVVKFGQNGQITLAAHNEAGDLKRRDAAANDVDPFKYIAPTAGGLKKLRARQVRVDQLGRVLDPGFPARKTSRPTEPSRPLAAE